MRYLLHLTNMTIDVDDSEAHVEADVYMPHRLTNRVQRQTEDRRYIGRPEHRRGRCGMVDGALPRARRQPSPVGYERLLALGLPVTTDSSDFSDARRLGVGRKDATVHLFEVSR